jgi:hypothetical protein
MKLHRETREEKENEFRQFTSRFTGARKEKHAYLRISL